MTARRTIERILRDEDDASAQTVRGWRLQAGDNFLSIARHDGEDGGLPHLIRMADIPQLVADLQELAQTQGREP